VKSAKQNREGRREGGREGGRGRPMTFSCEDEVLKEEGRQGGREGRTVD
jgi:general stress protein YciG